MKHASLVFMLLVSVLPAQNPVPPGTVLPLSLETTLNIQKIRPAKVIRAEVMQNIPGTAIHKGARVFGHVLSVTPSSIALTFDTLVANGKRIPIITNLRALASMMAIEEAQIPEGGADRGLPPRDKTTTQIGGEQVYHGGGPVTRGMTTVAEPTPYGARGRLQSNPPCRAAIAENYAPQALWLFSTNACGIYGYNHLSIEHSGRTNPVGTIILSSRPGKLHIRSGSGLLLRVQGS